jgi:hypothetical protein
VIERTAAGLDYLTLVTELLQRSRLADPTGGVWEAADLQWWWRRDQHPDAGRQHFWFEDGTAVAAVVLTDWGGRCGCDVLTAGLDSEAVVALVWPRLVELLDRLGSTSVQMTIPEDDAVPRRRGVGRGLHADPRGRRGDVDGCPRSSNRPGSVARLHPPGSPRRTRGTAPDDPAQW